MPHKAALVATLGELDELDAMLEALDTLLVAALEMDGMIAAAIYDVARVAISRTRRLLGAPPSDDGLPLVLPSVGRSQHSSPLPRAA